MSHPSLSLNRNSRYCRPTCYRNHRSHYRFWSRWRNRSHSSYYRKCPASSHRTCPLLPSPAPSRSPSRRHRVLLDVVLELLHDLGTLVSGQGGIALLHGCCNVLGDGGQVILRHLVRIHLFERDDGTVRFLVIFPGLDLTGRGLIGMRVTL